MRINKNSNKIIGSLFVCIFMLTAPQKTIAANTNKIVPNKLVSDFLSIGTEHTVSKTNFDNGIYFSNQTIIVYKLLELINPGSKIVPSSSADSLFILQTQDLNNDAEPEHLLFLGKPDNYVFFVILQKKNNSWEIIFSRQLYHHNPIIKLDILKVENNQKMACVVRLDGSGSGVLASYTDCYKIIDNKAHLCLTIPRKSYTPITSISAKIVTQNHEPIVKYSYSVAPFNIQLQKIFCKPPNYDCELPNVYYVNEDEEISYKWNAQTKKYFQYFTSKNNTLKKLNTQKISFFTDMNHNYWEEFAKTFDLELKELLKNGTANEKLIVEELYNSIIE
jgi:hypothetical protein